MLTPSEVVVPECLHKVETHCFSQNGCHILLDVRQSKFFAITPSGRDILAAQEGTPLETLREELRQRYGDAEISRALKRLRERGVLLPYPMPPIEPETPTLPILTRLELNVAQDCNLRCRYCIAEQGSFGGRRQRMSREVARQAVDFLLQESGEAVSCGLTFSGGEPMLDFRLIRDAVTYGQQEAARYDKLMEFFLKTNGTLFSDQNIAFIKEHQIGVQVSLDGPSAVHDRLRSTASGKGSHDTVIAGLSQLLMDYGTQVSIRATITRYSPPASELLDYLAGFGAGRVSLYHVMADGEDYALDLEARKQLKAEYSKLSRRFLAGAPGSDFSTASLFVPYLLHFCSGRKRRTFCGAGTSMLGVSASGELYPCHDLAELEEVRVGHVATGLDREKLARWRSYLDVDSKPLCRDCWARYICGGGCLAWAIKSRGNPHWPVEAECDLLRHLIQLAIWVHLELREKHPQVFLSLLPTTGLNRFNPNGADLFDLAASTSLWMRKATSRRLPSWQPWIR
jgi:uncharacterized protein